MSGYRFSFNVKDDHMAKSLGLALPISTRHSVEICKEIRGKKLEKAKSFLESVIAMKSPVRFRRYNKDVGHKPKVGPGRYPVKACAHILDVVKSAESNALYKGLNVNSLFLVHISAQAAARTWRYGRHTRRRNKRTNIEVVLEEKEIQERQKANQRQQKKKKPAEPANAHKPEEKKQPEKKPAQETVSKQEPKKAEEKEKEKASVQDRKQEKPKADKAEQKQDKKKADKKKVQKK
jgi:large subunit ribosomal protein L22